MIDKDENHALIYGRNFNKLSRAILRGKNSGYIYKVY